MNALSSSFQELFGRKAQVLQSAPGRVNLIGEHTDYNGGFVLPMAIPQRTHVAMAPRDDDTVRLASEQFEDARVVSFSLADDHQKTRTWIDYVRGVVEATRNSGRALRGFELLVTSDVPVGAGLSSSAALNVAVVRALRETFAFAMDDVEVAHTAYVAEHDFVGVPIGTMDPMACSLADEKTALFLDTRAQSFSRIELPAEGAIVVIDSGVSHEHAAGGYRVRRAECEEAARLLGVRELRDVDESELPRVMLLRDPLARRARHVITENARVLAAVHALRGGDLARVGALFEASHASMRDDFEMSVPDVDRLVRALSVQPSTYGARLTGGGFGGAVVALVKKGEAAQVAKAAVQQYESEGSRRAQILVGANA